MKERNLKYYLDIIEVFAICAVLFLIPVKIRISPYFIALAFVTFLVKKDNYRHLLESFKKIAFWILLLPFFWYLIGLTYTENMPVAYKQIETALSILVFPFIGVSYSGNKCSKKIKFAYFAFLLGILVRFVMCLIHASQRYAVTQDAYSWFYDRLANSPHHLSYFVLWGIVLITVDVIRNNLKQGSGKMIVPKLVLLLLFSAFVVMLSSKITILLYVIFVFSVLVYLIHKRLLPLFASTMILCVFAALVVSVFTFLPMIHTRFTDMVNTLEKYKANPAGVAVQRSTAIRITVAGAATDIIKDNFWTGVGTGDILDEMKASVNKYSESYHRSTTPHNQFLRFFATFGVFGFLSLLALFVMMFVKSAKRNDMLFLLWAIITMALFCVEDIFAIIHGVEFFCLFTSYFVLVRKLERKEE